MRAVDLPEYRRTRPDRRRRRHLHGRLRGRLGQRRHRRAGVLHRATAARPTTCACARPSRRRRSARRTAAVRIDSLVAPPIGSAGGTNGTLAVAGPATATAVAVAGLAGDASPATRRELHRHRDDQRGRAARSSPTSRSTPTTSRSTAPGYVDPEGIQAVRRRGRMRRAPAAPRSRRCSTTARATLTATLRHARTGTRSHATLEDRRRRAARALTVDQRRHEPTAAARIFPATRPPRRSRSITADEPLPLQRRLRRLLRRAARSRTPSRSTPRGPATNACKFVDRGQTSTDDRPPAGAARARRERHATATAPHKNKPEVGRRGQRAGASSWTARPPRPATPRPTRSRASPRTRRTACSPIRSGIATYAGTVGTSRNYEDGLLGFVTRKAPALRRRVVDRRLLRSGPAVGHVAGLRRRRRHAATSSTVVNTQPTGSSTYVVIDVASRPARRPPRAAARPGRAPACRAGGGAHEPPARPRRASRCPSC